MPKVSVVIPAYNTSSFICTTLRSVLISTFRDLEIVVVDDGSTDATAEMVDAFDSRVRLVRQANAGVSVARNSGIQSSDSELLAFLDSDDVWHPQKLELQLRALEHNPKYAMAYSEFLPWDGESPLCWSPIPDGDRLVADLSGWIYHHLILTNWALPSTWLMRRTVVDSVGGFEAGMSMGEDWDLIIRISREFQIAKLASPLVRYRLSRAQTTKRLAARNEAVEMRQRFLSAYGETGPDGSRVDEVKLRQRQRDACYYFGLDHIVSGNLRMGIDQVRQSVGYGFNTHLPVDVLKSLLKRFIGSRNNA